MKNISWLPIKILLKRNDPLFLKLENLCQVLGSMWKVLFLSLEFADPVFSGNGIYGRTIVKMLELNGCEVMVLCAQPQGAKCFETRQQLTVLSVPVRNWFKLDAECDWEAYGRGVKQFSNEVRRFQPDIVIAVDWSSLLALQTLRHAGTLTHIPAVYFNFRVFSALDGPKEFYIDKEKAMMQCTNATVALSQADANLLLALDPNVNMHVLNPSLRPEVLTLSKKHTAWSTAAGQQLLRHRSDNQQTLMALYGSIRELRRNGTDNVQRSHSMNENEYDIATFPNRRRQSIPNLSSEMSGGSTKEDLLRANEQRIQYGFGGPRPVVYNYLKSKSFGKRRFITCCGRVCKEKNTQVFVDIMIHLQQFLKANGLIPCLVGPPVDNAFANNLYKRLDAVFPGDLSKVVPRFVDIKELAGIWSETVLNIHPAEYEAYGMTIAEAAAFAVPTLMDGQGLIGAADLLPWPNYSFSADMRNMKQSAAVVKSIVRKSSLSLLRCIGASAQTRALAWNDACFSESLIHLMEIVLQHKFRAYSLTKSVDLPPSVKPPKDIERIEDEWLWVEILEWVVSGMVLRDGQVLNVDLEVVRNLSLHLLNQSTYSLCKMITDIWQSLVNTKHHMLIQKNDMEEKGATRGELLAQARTQVREFLDTRKTASEWAKHLLAKYPVVPAARYRLVPSRLPEVGFWYCIFSLIRNAVMSRLRPDPIEAIGRRLVGMNVVDDSLQLSLVAGQLLHCKRLVVVTGYPSVSENPVTPQKLDGPLCAAMIVRATKAVNTELQGATIITERMNSFALQSCLGVFYGPPMRYEMKANSLTEKSFFKDNVWIETFPSESVMFTRSHRDYLEAGFTCEPNTHVMFVERVGPSLHKGVYCDLNLVPMKGVNSLDIISSQAKSTSSICSSIPNVIGMGALHDYFRDNFPLGDRMVCPKTVDNICVAPQATVAGFAVLGTLALLAAEEDLISKNSSGLEVIMGSEAMLRDGLIACASAGSCDENGHRDTIGGLDFESIVLCFKDIQSIVLSHWN